MKLLRTNYSPLYGVISYFFCPSSDGQCKCIYRLEDSVLPGHVPKNVQIIPCLGRDHGTTSPELVPIISSLLA